MKNGLPAPPAGNARPGIVLLGASNLTLRLSWLVRRARQWAGVPADFFIAAGFGRSYGKGSRVLFRGLPSILECGLWDALEDSSSAPLWVLMTDIGNDILYVIPPGQIAEWVAECLDRFARRGARVAMTLMPLESGSRTSSFRFQLLRRILFPHCTLTLRETLVRGEMLQEQLHRIGRERDIPLIELPGEWFGGDPIHYRRNRLPDLWKGIEACWSGANHKTGEEDNEAKARCTRFARPERRRLFGRDQFFPQPSVSHPSIGTISLF